MISLQSKSIRSIKMRVPGIRRLKQHPRIEVMFSLTLK